jgi:protease I
MAEKNLAGIRVAAIATDGVEESELLQPKKALEEAGAEVKVISPKSGSIQGLKHIEKASQIPVDLPIAEANPEHFDAVLLPGGVVNADALRIDHHAQEFVRSMDESGKPIAVICHGPWLLVSAGLVGERRLTSWPTLEDDIRNAGGEWTDQEVLVDENWVSSRNPDDIPAFNREIIRVLAERKQTREAA